MKNGIRKKTYLFSFLKRYASSHYASHILRVPVCRKNVLNNVSSSPDLSSTQTYSFPE